MHPPSGDGLEPSGPAAPRARARALIFLPPLILTIVATTQIFLSKKSTLAPWKGGGFGMFSSVDLEGYRVARAYLTSEDGQDYAIRLEAVDEFEYSLPQASAFPTEERLGALADRMLRMNWRKDANDRVVTPLPRGSREPRLRAAAIRLEILKLVFDRESGRVDRVLIADITRERS
jgi:hypothetical protein